MIVNITEYQEDDRTLYKADKSVDEIATAICKGEHVTWLHNTPDYCECGVFNTARFSDGYPDVSGVAFNFGSYELGVNTLEGYAYEDEGNYIEYWEYTENVIPFSPIS